MCKTRMLALLAGLAIGFPGVSTATLLHDDLKALPSSFAGQTSHQTYYGDQLENAGVLEFTDAANIFSRFRFPGISFRNAATQGLSAARPDPVNRSIEELIALGSLGGDLNEAFDDIEVAEADTDRRISAGNSIPQTGPTLRDVAKTLVNRPLGTDRRPRRREEVEPREGFSLVDFVLGTQIDDGFIDTTKKIVSPTIDADGLIALNFLGLRDFALLLSPVTDNLQILDLKTGATVTINHAAFKGGNDGGGSLSHNPRSSGRKPLSAHPAVQFLKKVERFVRNFVLHPITLGALFLVSVSLGAVKICTRAS